MYWFLNDRSEGDHEGWDTYHKLEGGVEID